MSSRHRTQPAPGREREPSRSHQSSSKDPHRRHEPNSAPEGRTRINAVDLDQAVSGRKQYAVGIKSTATLRSIISYLRRRFPSKSEGIPDNAVIQFFTVNGQLSGEDIPHGLSTLHYRVLDPVDDGSFQFRWGGRPDSRWHISADQLNTLLPLVESGCTIGSLRKSIKDLLATASTNSRVEDANQVVIQAGGGLRPGPLQGNQWEARKIATWRCRYFLVDVRSPKNYFVFQGFNQKYIWHNPSLDERGSAEGRALKKWLKQSVLTNVHPRGTHRRGVDVDDIRLLHHGKLVKNSSSFRSGGRFSFELSRSVGDSYIQAESWLVPKTVRCTVCDEDRRVSELPHMGHVTAACSHDANICKECICDWITASLDTGGWNNIKCPDCPQLLKYEDVRAFASPETFQRYDSLATKDTLGLMDKFQWCLNPNCNAGQINDSQKCAKAKCYACSYAICTNHSLPWHSKETCEEFDRRNPDKVEINKRSEREVSAISKPCPRCKTNVYKIDGCDHITCKCGYEWCWLCFAEYVRDDTGSLSCEHTEKCGWYEGTHDREEPVAWQADEQHIRLERGQGRRHDHHQGHEDRRRHHNPRLDDEADRLLRRAVNRNPHLNAHLAGPDQPRGLDTFMDQATRFNFGNVMSRAR